ncbi:hypothetical protein SJ_34 [Proteus phage SJ_PmiM]|nr:hypothetical protein SJ_34 [Proteus phage SJ_PmiM]
MEQYLGRLVFKNHVDVLEYGRFSTSKRDFAIFVITKNLQKVPFSVYFDNTETTSVKCVFDTGEEFSDKNYGSYIIPISPSLLTFKYNNIEFIFFDIIDNNTKKEPRYMVDIPAKTLNSKEELVCFVNELLEHLK